MKSLKQSVILFFGISIMLMFSYFNYTVLRDIKDVLILTKADALMIPYLKIITIPVTLIVGALMILLACGGKIGRVFKVYFPINTLIASIFSWLFYVNSPLIDHLNVMSCFYLWANISMISIILVWGFANQEYTFETAAIQYPILGLLFTGIAVRTSGLFIVNFSSPNETYPIMLSIVAALNLLTLAVYLWMSRSNLGVKEKGVNVTWSYWVALAAIVFALKFVVFFPDLVFKYLLRPIFPDPHSYSTFMSDLVITKMFWGLLAGIVSIILGFVLYFRGPKALSKVVGLIVFGMLVGGASFFYLSQTVKLDKETLMTSTMGYTLFGSLMGIFTIFKELAFFGIERTRRFTAKIAIDVMVIAIAPSAASYITMSTLRYGSLGENTTLFAAIFIVGMIVCFPCLYRINRDLKYSLSSPEKTVIQM